MTEKLSKSALKDFLDEKVIQYKTADFIEEDPIQIPYLFSKKQDQEITGLFSALIAWGNRKSIIKDSQKLMQMMENNPYEFVLNFNAREYPNWQGSLHRTFMAEDFVYLLENLQRLYKQEESLESYFLPQKGEHNLMPAIERFRNAILSTPHRAAKHISSPEKGSAAKRIHMFLRWMVREDEVDLGIWKNISTSKLSIPLDTHTLGVAHYLGMIDRKNNNRKTVEELDSVLREMNAEDPVSYDFALFGLGAYEKFKE